MKKIQNSYKKSGVNFSLANKLVKHISLISKKGVKKTKNSFDRDVIGGFGSLFDISKLNIKDPIIVSCTYGVGTKIELANKFKKFDTIGIDLVAMCINDLIVQGAKPLFFLDYIAIGKLDLNKTKKILKGIFEGCRLSNCKLIGGETAEMPGTYSKNKFDMKLFGFHFCKLSSHLRQHVLLEDQADEHMSYILAFLFTAVSRSSKTTTPPPPAITKPSRYLSKALEDFEG